MFKFSQHAHEKCIVVLACLIYIYKKISERVVSLCVWLKKVYLVCWYLVCWRDVWLRSPLLTASVLASACGLWRSNRSNDTGSLRLVSLVGG